MSRAHAGLGFYLLKATVQQRLTLIKEGPWILRNRSRQRTGLGYLFEQLTREQLILNGTVLPTANNPDIARSEPVLQFDQ